nr:hypothetical protein [Comamonas testosteroni]
MPSRADRRSLLLSLQRALLGAAHPQLRQASIEADVDRKHLLLRFEYDGAPCEEAREACSIAAAEVLADLAGPWTLDEQHLAAPRPQPLAPLAHIGYRRWEG